MNASRTAARGCAATAWALGLALILVALARIGLVHAQASHAVLLTVRTPHGGFNRLVVSLTVCAPGTDRCAHIDDVMVDTGSTGLRLEGSAVPSWLHLPPVLGPDGRPMAECLRFVSDVAWGPLYRADLRLGDLTAPGLPLQIIDDGTQPQPASCPHSDVQPTSNGTLGIGPQLSDCQEPCRQSVAFPGVFTCGREGCGRLGDQVAAPYRLPNPILFFPRHNNGVAFDLPIVPSDGLPFVNGTLTLGVGTDDANQMPAAAIVPLGPSGRFTTLYAGIPYPESYIDSGTETAIVPGDTAPRCPGMDWAFCANPPAERKAIVIGTNGTSIPVPFRIGDYRAIRNNHFGASDSIAVAAAPGSNAFVWGAPFFLGKRTFVVIDGKTVPGMPGVRGPFYAFVPNRPP